MASLGQQNKIDKKFEWYPLRLRTWNIKQAMITLQGMADNRFTIVYFFTNVFIYWVGMTITICCKDRIRLTALFFSCDILSGYYINLLFGHMVKFGLPVFQLLGLLVINLAFQFFYYSAFRIRPYGSVRSVQISICFKRGNLSMNLRSEINY